MMLRPAGMPQRPSLSAAVRYVALILALAISFASNLFVGHARAQDLLQPGEAYLTRFSGTTAQDGQTIIDMGGTVGSIIDIRNPGQAPQGQHWAGEPQRLPVTAAQVGQVFGIALDRKAPPSIFITATSAFGLHRTADNADWMAGMWGTGGGPGTVWKLSRDNNYQPEPFANIALAGRANTGAALGNIAYDRWNRQLYVSDLETGMIHRLSAADGSDFGYYDHGTQGRVNFTDATTGVSQSLAAVAFNPGTQARINDCAFGAFTSTPACWNFADFRRRVWGLGVRRDNATGEVRLYYSIWGSQGFGHPEWPVAGDEQRNSVWSVRIAASGGFDTSDVRREFFLPDFFTEAADITRAGPSHPVADIAFPCCTEQNVMVVVERGGVRNLGLDAEEPFAWPHESRAIRYRLDSSGVWRAEGRYDVGHQERPNMPQIRANASGGAAFGLGYSDTWSVDPGQPDRFLWMTGHSLCSPEGPCFDPATGGHSDTSEVHGMQGTPVDRATEITPAAPVPADGPNSSYMIDADANGDPARNDATKIGDVEIYEPCVGIGIPGAPGVTGFPIPPPEACPLDFLEIEKTGPEICLPGAPCPFTVTITNVSGRTYTGPIHLMDVPPPGATLLAPPPPAGWNCHQFGGSHISCISDPAIIGPIPPGGSVSFDLVLQLPPWAVPGDYENCIYLVWPTDPAGIAAIDLPPGGSWEVAWVEIALAERGLLPWGLVDGFYDAGNPLDPTQAAIDALLGTPPGTGTLAQAQAALFLDSSALHQDCNSNNDHDCATVRVPGPPPGPQPDLAVSKFLFDCQPVNGGYICLFAINIWNNSGLPYTGPLHINDTLPPGGQFNGIAGTSAGLVGIGCGPWLGNVIDCTLPMPPGVTIAPLGWEWIDIWVFIPDGRPEGELNCAELGIPEHIGDPDDPANPNDNNRDCAPTAFATVGILSLTTDLAVDKTGPGQCTAGGLCTYTVTVTNNSSGVFNGPLDIVDMPSGVPGVTFVDASPGWTCTPSGSVINCHHGPVTLNPSPGPGHTITLDITLQLPPSINPDTSQLSNCSWLVDVQPHWGQWGSLTPLRKKTLTPLERVKAAIRKASKTPLISFAQAAKAKSMTGTTVKEQRKQRSNKRKPRVGFFKDRKTKNNRDCVTTKIITPSVTPTPVPVPPPPPLTCPPGWKKFSNASLIPKGWKWTKVTRGRRVIFCAKPPIIEPPVCNRGERLFTNRGAVPKGWTSHRVSRGGRTIYCAKPPRPCPDGTTGIYPNCKPISRPTCAQRGMIGNYPNCKPRPKPTCAQRGMIGNYPNCKPRAKPTCAQRGMIGNYPNCKPRPKPTCAQRGMIGNYPNCKPRPKPTCAQRGMIGNYPNCKPRPKPPPKAKPLPKLPQFQTIPGIILCPKGTKNIGGKCVRVVQ